MMRAIPDAMGMDMRVRAMERENMDCIVSGATEGIRAGGLDLLTLGGTFEEEGRAGTSGASGEMPNLLMLSLSLSIQLLSLLSLSVSLTIRTESIESTSVVPTVNNN